LTEVVSVPVLTVTRIQGRAMNARGITIMELMIVVAILALLSTMVGQRVKPTLDRADAANAAAIVALDLEHAVTLAARQRRPVRISQGTPGSYTLADRASGSVFFHRALGTAVALSPERIDVFPNGLTSAALSVTVGVPPVTRGVTMSTGGFVRVVR
jgi:type II secretory pathway pseudopilin PulG